MTEATGFVMDLGAHAILGRAEESTVRAERQDIAGALAVVLGKAQAPAVPTFRRALLRAGLLASRDELEALGIAFPLEATMLDLLHHAPWGLDQILEWAAGSDRPVSYEPGSPANALEDPEQH